MKRFIYSLISCFLSITFLENCRQADSFVIEGKVAGVEEGSIVQLALELSAAMATRPFVETRVENGRFVLQGGLEGPRYCRLQVIDGRKKYITHLMVENSEIAITAKAGEGSAWWEEFEVKGSSSDKLLREKIVFQEECRKALDNKQKEYFALVRKMKKNKTLDESDSLKMAKLQKEIPEAEEKWEVDRVRMAKEAISRDKESFWGPLLMIAINRGSFNLRSETNLELYQQFSVEAQESYYGHILKQILYPKEFEKRLPAFSGMDREGNIRTDRELWQGKNVWSLIVGQVLALLVVSIFRS